MTMTPLQIEEKIQQSLPSWDFKDNFLSQNFSFHDFVEAFSFMTAIAMEAEKMDHHPNWENVYNRVIIRLSTHDKGRVTEKDLALGMKIDLHYAKYTRS